MKGLKRESTVHLRISEQEKNKYNKVSSDIGLSLSAFFRYSAAKASRLINTNEDEIL
jgi:antitoxin component of RelBE/YafQ-DinJ toxin-antitoxin module|tara:strand:- start:5209 stop:5379 length:171 start_codon:yes stop_codon:yes gene_type:complete